MKKSTVTVGRYAGFCPGVTYAVETVEKLAAAKESGRVVTLGMIIHNRTVVEELKEKGVYPIEESDLPLLYEKALRGEVCTVAIRAHGVTKQVRDQLDRWMTDCPCFRVVDCTCVKVKKIHRIVKEESTPDNRLVVFGAPEHPEVRGICSYAAGECVVVRDEAEAKENILSKKETILLSQTTQNCAEWKKCKKIFENLCTNRKIFDTICSVTDHRQTEVAEMCKTCDTVFVIGSKESSNTVKLYEEAKKYIDAVYLIENSDELPDALMAHHIGITAGASTPGRIIEEVHKKMNEILENENFEELLNESFKTLNTGDTVTGVVTSVSGAELTVDVGAKVTGIIPFDEVAEDSSVDLTKTYKVGDTVVARAIRVSDVEGVAMLSVKQAERTNSFKKLVEASETGEVLTGRVIDVVKGGLVVSAKYNRVFIPAGQSGVPKEGDLNVLKGKTVKFKIIDMDTEKNRAVGSIRVVEREERKAKLEEFWAGIEEGKTYLGTVKSLTSFGAFVDLGGIDGMIHTTELSWSKIKHPSEVVSVGQTVEVYVKSFDKDKKRISLGYKKTEDNPWVIFTSKYAVGDIAPVKIVSLMPFGAFAEVIPGADGLIHISQIADKRIAKPADELEVGQVVDAKIIGIDEEKQKISLSIRAIIAPESVEEPVEEADGAEEAVAPEEA